MSNVVRSQRELGMITKKFPQVAPGVFQLEKGLIDLLPGDTTPVREEGGIIFVSFDEANTTEAAILFIGQADTPFKFGAILCTYTMKEDYPSGPPKVKNIAMTTVTKLHPNFYTDKEGKVCLSIINTWSNSSGNGWSPIYNIEKVSQQLAALLDSEPVKHEPGHEDEKKEDIEKFNKETRIAAVFSLLKLAEMKSEIAKPSYRALVSYAKSFVEAHKQRIKEYALSLSPVVDSHSVHWSYGGLATVRTLHDTLKLMANRL